MIELSSVNLAIIEIIPGGAGPMSIILSEGLISFS